MAPKTPIQNSVLVRPAEVRDYDSALGLWRAVDLHHIRLVPGVFQWVGDGARSRSLFARLVTNRNGLVLVAADGERLTGLLTAELRGAPRLPLFRPRTIAYVGAIIVDEEWRRRGIGRALMDGALAWANRRAASRIELSVYAENGAATRFYERLGYRTTQRIMALDVGEPDAGR